MGFSGWALRNLLDGHQRLTQQGLQVFIRTMNNDVDDDGVGEAGEFVTYGFQLTVTGGVGESGVTDTLINPPPDVQAMTLHNIGMAGGQLRFGAHSFLISHTWVLERMNQLGLTDPYEVFNGEAVVGLMYNTRLFSIESLVANTGAGEIISWLVLANMFEVPPTT